MPTRHPYYVKNKKRRRSHLRGEDDDDDCCFCRLFAIVQFGFRRLCRRRHLFLVSCAFSCILWLCLSAHLSPLAVFSAIWHYSRWRGHPTLAIDKTEFRLKDKENFRVLSGSIHYFRVAPEYWPDRLRKLKAAGLNTVDTYVPWNLHEPTPANFIFDGQADLCKFLDLAQTEGLFVILRPGPYICAEWDWGGLPAWLLKDDSMRVRTMHRPYLDAVERYFGTLIPLIVGYQHGNGGPIIMVQVENEYGSYRQDGEYLTWLRDLLVALGVTELLFTSDGFSDGRLEAGTIPGVFATINDRDSVSLALRTLRKFQPGKPLMVTEFWSGWFDHWSQPHHTFPVKNFSASLNAIIQTGASVNLFMFHGGSNFGFWNGANMLYDRKEGKKPPTRRYTTTSYDYDAPLTEDGRMSPKYHELTRLLQNLPESELKPNLALGKKLAVDGPQSESYGRLPVRQMLSLTQALKLVEPWTVRRLCSMEQICAALVEPTAKCRDQNLGFVAYRTQAPSIASELKLQIEFSDRLLVIIDGVTVAVLDGFVPGRRTQLQFKLSRNRPNDVILLVENMGRVNYDNYPNRIDGERKGILNGSSVFLDEEPVPKWQVYKLEMEPEFLTRLAKEAVWSSPEMGAPSQPAFYRMLPLQLALVAKSKWPADTFLNFQGWGKGVGFVNGFNLGRYWETGPQRSVFVPGPRLIAPSSPAGRISADFILFELHKAAESIRLESLPEFET